MCWAEAEACLVYAAALMILIHPWTNSRSTGSIAPGVAITPLIKPTTAMQMSSQPSTGQEAAGERMLKKHRLQMVTAAEGTDAAAKKMSSGMGTEVVAEETGTALGEKNRSDRVASGGTGM